MSSVTIQYEELKVVIAVYPGDTPTDPEAYAAARACRYLRMQGIPLPVPFDLVFTAARSGGAVVPDEHRRHIAGLLTRCP